MVGQQDLLRETLNELHKFFLLNYAVTLSKNPVLSTTQFFNVFALFYVSLNYVYIDLY